MLIFFFTLNRACLTGHAFYCRTQLAFAANTCMLFFCLAGNLALMPPATQRIFGPKAGATIYGKYVSRLVVSALNHCKYPR
jgi:hypothetical protein